VSTHLTLAPLEGVIDSFVRELLTGLGGYDLCITEFLRISNTLMPDRSFHKLCPELHHGGKTRSGVPVRIQLLGQTPQYLSENANRAIELGSHGIDLNLGCPSKIVNNNKGGAVLLKEPETIYQLVKAMRNSIPAKHTFSVKIRLGWDDENAVHEIGDAIVQGGANELTVHARTKVDGYKQDAIKWPMIGQLKIKQQIALRANGEIWNREDAFACQTITGCNNLMLGRGALALPNLAAVIKGHRPMDYLQLLVLLNDYAGFDVIGGKNKDQYYPNRMKQWLSYLRRQYPQTKALFSQIRTLTDRDDVVAVINSELERQRG